MNEVVMKAFEFETQVVRVELFDGEPWWAAKDVAIALGYAETSVANNMSNLVAKVPEEWRGNKPFIGPMGTQEMLALSEQGLYFFLNRSNMEKALPFQKWIAGEVLPSIRKTGGYAVAKTPAEMLLDSVQMLVEQERRQRAVEAEQRAQGARLTAIEQRAEAGERALRALPAPAVEAPGRTQRMEINQLVRNFCYQTGADHRAAWGRLYREVRDRCHVDLKRRADNAEMSVLDLAEHLDAGEMPGLLRQIYAVAHDLFVTGPARIVREGQDVEA